jgi:hypothetical protein
MQPELKDEQSLKLLLQQKGPTIFQKNPLLNLKKISSF